MPVTGVVLKALEARRYQDPAPNSQIRIDHASNLSLVQAEGTTLKVEFAYTTSYGPLGVVKVEGTLTFSDPKAKEAAEEWGRSRNLPAELAQPVHQAIMAACVPQAVILAKDLRMPPPVPLPQVRFDKKPAAAAAPAKPDAYGSPEVG